MGRASWIQTFADIASMARREDGSRRGWRAYLFALPPVLSERIVFEFFTTTLMQSLVETFHENPSMAAILVAAWTGVAYLTAVLWSKASIRFGQYWTIAISFAFYLSGMVMMAVAVSLVQRDHNSSHSKMFLAGIFILAVGAGGTTLNLYVIGASRFSPNEYNLFINLWSLSVYIGCIIGDTVMVIAVRRHLGWKGAYGIATGLLFVSMILVFSGRGGFFHRNEASSQGRKGTDTSEIPWRKDEDTQGDTEGTTGASETRDMGKIKIFLIWLTLQVASLLYCQVNTVFLHGATGLKSTIPPATMKVFTTGAAAASATIVLLFFKSGNPTNLIGLGYLVQAVAMLIAMVTEMTTLRSSRRGDSPPPSVLILLPQYALMGISDGFIQVGRTDLLDGPSWPMVAVGFGNLWNCLLVYLVTRFTQSETSEGWLAKNLRDSRLDHYYTLLFVLAILEFIAFEITTIFSRPAPENNEQRTAAVQPNDELAP